MSDGAAASASGHPEVADELSLKLTAVALGPDYPPAAVSAEIGRVAVAAARVDQASALLLHALHGGKRAQWNLEVLQTHTSGELKKQSLHRLEELFEGALLAKARDVVQDAHAALEHRHAVMHTVWTLSGPDALTSVVPDVLAALRTEDPDASLSALVGRDVESNGWQTLHPRSGTPGPASMVELRDIRRALENAQGRLEELRFELASALYCGRPTGARRVLNPDTGGQLGS